VAETGPVRVVVSGVDAAGMAALAEQAGAGRVRAAATGDMAGARLVETGRADFYLGTCWSGGGGALAAATAILGARRVGIAGTPGRPVRADRMREFLSEGRSAFGFPHEQSASAIPTIVHAILEHLDESGRAAEQPAG
jgi:hypothetical protein